VLEQPAATHFLTIPAELEANQVQLGH